MIVCFLRSIFLRCINIFGTINLKLLIPIEIHVAKINNENLTHAFFYILCGKN